MAKYKVIGEATVKNATVIIEPTEELIFRENDLEVENQLGVTLSFKMHNPASLDRSIRLSNQDVDNLFAAIREVQRLRDGATARGSHTEAQESPKIPNQ